MALTKVTSGGITDSAITSAKINDGAITNDDIKSDAAITAGKLSATLDLSSKTVTLPASSVTAHATNPTKASIEALGIAASSITGALPAIDGSSLTGITTDTTTIENNIAMLGFYRATDHSKNKYNLVDQVIDDYNDATGIDASASTNEVLTSGYYHGQAASTGNATGGTITTSGGYKYHEFPHTGGLNAQTTATFTTPGTGTIDYLIVGGGGSGQSMHAGGRSAGRGGYLQLFTGQSKTAGNYSIVTGGGGQGYTTWNDGQASSAFGTTKNGGTKGYNTSGAGHAGTTVSQFSQFGVSGVFAGGGGYTCYNGGSGGGGRGGCANGDNPPGGVNGTGGGGGAGNTHYNASGNAGSGIVLVRYQENAFSTTVTGNLILQSVASTASSAPSTGDLVTLIENSAGTATLNTDIKGYISRDSGANFTQGTLVDEGSWGTNKKILAFHDLDISGQPSGTAICYKITTHNQSASKSTKIHATSLAWA